MPDLILESLKYLVVIVLSVLVIAGTIRLLFNKVPGEKLSLYIDFTKWIVVSVALVIIASVVDASFKDRAAGINEIEQYDKYVNMVVANDRIGAKKRLAEFYSLVTASEKLRIRWEKYYVIVEKEFNDSVEMYQKLRDTLSHITDSATKEQYINRMSNLSDDLQTKVNTGIPQTKAQTAADFEGQGFTFLLDRDFEKAMEAFNNAEQSLHGYHSVYDILFYLRNHKELASPTNEAAWKQAYKDILKKFPWGMPDDIKEKMEQASK